MKRKIFLFLAIVSVVGMIAMSGCNRPENYTVTFNSNGGTGTMATQTFTEGEAQALTRNTFTYDGYTFIGWNTVQGGSGTIYSDGQTITATADMILYAQWTSNGTNQTPSPSPTPQPTTGTLNGHEWVDLGLPSGTRWATCNVGSTTPEGYGDYFAWGETSTKTSYNSSTYTYSDNPTTLPSSADAATANWGSGWRMPTWDECKELILYSTITRTTQNGVYGYLFSKGGNSIFLPAAGCYGYDINDGSTLIHAGSHGYYWSSSRYMESSFDPDAWAMMLYASYNGVFCPRSNGYQVRPVSVSQK